MQFSTGVLVHGKSKRCDEMLLLVNDRSLPHESSTRMGILFIWSFMRLFFA